jgi:hypothetical protein
VSEDKQFIRGRLDVGGLAVPIWLIGWLFTIGFAHLPTAKAIVALALWPYYLGLVLRP